jgi:two-component system chemotaxis response regulator CheB
VIVIGGSAGGIDALRTLVAGLPRDLPAAVFVVIHLPPYSPSMLPHVLTAAGTLPATHPTDGEEFRNGNIYVAPPDHHLLIEDGRVLVRQGPRENRLRPSVDALFRSAAYVHGPRVIGLVISGVLDDGTSGLWSIKRLGGTAIVQDPDDAMHPEMPRSAIEQVEVDHVRPAAALGALLGELAGTEVAERPAIPQEQLERLGREIDIAARGGAFDTQLTSWGELAPFTCPDCHGALVKFAEGSLLRFRCHIGHAFSPRALLAGITEGVEDTLGQALRGLEEQTSILEYLGEHFRTSGHEDAAVLFAANARSSRARIEVVQGTLPGQHQLTSEISRSK